MPAVVLMLGIALMGLQLAAQQVRLQSAVAGAARLIGRGASGGLDLVHQVSPDANLGETTRGDLVCVTATAPVAIGVLPGITLSATSCSLSDGG